ncbi:MAG: nicotinate (nicotinamide) nucleotide adenylyltransferase [Planctomycetota bacterium]|nr:nicotinate (nicotinamide) nucleotide adenylyltransferase [Planctomycetota bacterium]
MTDSPTNDAAPMRLPLGPFTRMGIMGGSFNPVHVGHLSIAQQMLVALKLERVFLMPAAMNPHKLGDQEMVSPDDRLAMCRLAVRNMRGMDVSDLELRRPAPSFTIDTARMLREAYGGGAEIRFLIGSDSLADLPKWREAAELARIADFGIADRRETPLAESVWEQVRAGLGEEAEKKLRAAVVPVERVDVSSTQIRKLLRTGEKIPGYLRRDVEMYIREKGLYGAAPAKR